jgi:hypothetical protein
MDQAARGGIHGPESRLTPFTCRGASLCERLGVTGIPSRDGESSVAASTDRVKDRRGDKQLRSLHGCDHEDLRPRAIPGHGGHAVGDPADG